MLSMSLVFLKGLWNKVTGYVILVASALALLWAAYKHGKDYERNESARRALGRDLETRGEADSIRRDAAFVPDPADELRRRWTRPGR